MKFLKKLLLSKSANSPQEPEILLEDDSPLCPITATVEQDDKVAYFYLHSKEQPNFGMKACWIRNLVDAPDIVDEKALKKGIPPMLPREFCKFPEGQERLPKKGLTIVWLEEGDGAALLLDEEVIAIIPTWSGFGNFNGYARDCKGEGTFAWELNESNDLLNRVFKSRDFWEAWDSTINPFQLEQPNIVNYYKEVLGESDKYFAIDHGERPVGLYLRTGESNTIFATVALSLSPMPTIEMHFENRESVNRIELGLMLNSPLSDDQIQGVANWMKGTISIPWDNITFLGEGHTVYFDAFNSMIFKNVLLTNKLGILPKIEMENYAGTRTKFLWMLPISDNEQEYMQKNGSEALLPQLEELGSEIFSLEREELV